MPSRKASEAELSCEEYEVVKLNSKKQKLNSASKSRGTGKSASSAAKSKNAAKSPASATKAKNTAKKVPNSASKSKSKAKTPAKKESNPSLKGKGSAKKGTKSASKSKAAKQKAEASDEEIEDSEMEMEVESDVQEMESDDNEPESSSHNASETEEPASASKTKPDDEQQDSANDKPDDEEPGSALKSKSKAPGSASKEKSKSRKKGADKEDNRDARFIGAPIKKEEAKLRWPDRYSKKKPEKDSDDGNDKKRKGSADDEDDSSPAAACAAHYSKADVDGIEFELGVCVHVNSGGGDDYIGKIVEFFEDVKKEKWFTAQWFFRLQDTAVKDVELSKHDNKRVFISNVKDLNPLDCLVSKIKIIKLSPQHHFNVMKPKPLPPCDYYYDMSYDYDFSRFCVLPPDAEGASSESDITNCNDVSQGQTTSSQSETRTDTEVSSGDQEEYTLLDLYSGCGGMSTGLCMGAALSSARLVTKWSLDLNPNACTSLQYNHPETNVRNESADDFLELLKEWKKLCEKYALDESVEESKISPRGKKRSKATSQEDEGEDEPTEPGEFEVEKIMGIRHVGASGDDIKAQIEYNVRWKGYGPSEDTWEPAEGLGSCEDAIREFVVNGRRNRILPMPGDVDVICGGPPCQGASGFNRFRNKENPLADARNKQIIVYMDIVNFLRPRFVLMENVVDILKFANGLLGRYALYRMVQMHYQVQLGMMVAGCYGLPQFRMRVFVWGAAPNEKLPAYPLPTHDVIPKGGIPQEWERNMVAYTSGKRPSLQKALTLGDALRDLPAVKNSESRDEMNYEGGAKTEFQRFIRLPKEVLTGTASLASCKKQKLMLYDHRPLTLNQDDYQRVCRIPHKKGANFRCLPGVIVRDDNTVALDPDMERVLLPSGKPLVPDYAITFVKGKSPKPFGRLWWDETVPTVVTRAEPHNQIILHPEQDRVLTIRENARLQGFPDCYKLFGPVKQRYIQVGNAVAVPVGRVLGYSLGLAFKQMAPSTPVMILPSKFPHSLMKSAQQINDIPLEPMDVEDSA